MRKRLAATLFPAAAAALTLGLGATSSLAATTTWSVTPGGTIKGSAKTTVIKDTTAGVTVSCATSTLNGSLKKGRGLAGQGIGTVKSVAFNNCSVLGQTISLSSGTVSWRLNAASYNSGTGVTSGTISGIHLVISSSLCSAVIDGTGGSAHNGQVKITYTNGTHKLKILPVGGNLHVYNVSGCGGLIANHDAVTISGAYTVSPVQKITSP